MCVGTWTWTWGLPTRCLSSCCRHPFTISSFNWVKKGICTALRILDPSYIWESHNNYTSPPSVPTTSDLLRRLFWQSLYALFTWGVPQPLGSSTGGTSTIHVCVSFQAVQEMQERGWCVLIFLRSVLYFSTHSTFGGRLLWQISLNGHMMIELTLIPNNPYKCTQNFGFLKKNFLQTHTQRVTNDKFHF